MQFSVLFAGLLASVAVAAPAPAPAAEPGLFPSYVVPSFAVPSYAMPIKSTKVSTKSTKSKLPVKTPPGYALPTQSVGYKPWKRSPEAEANPEFLNMKSLEAVWASKLSKLEHGYGPAPKPTKSVGYKPWKRNPEAEAGNVVRDAIPEAEAFPTPEPVLMA